MGWKKEKGMKLFNVYHDFIIEWFSLQASKSENDILNFNELDILEAFLESKKFKELGIVLETSNDYFLLGSLWEKSRESISKTIEVLKLAGALRPIKEGVN